MEKNFQIKRKEWQKGVEYGQYSESGIANLSELLAAVTTLK